MCHDEMAKSIVTGDRPLPERVSALSPGEGVTIVSRCIVTAANPLWKRISIKMV